MSLEIKVPILEFDQGEGLPSSNQNETLSYVMKIWGGGGVPKHCTFGQNLKEKKKKSSVAKMEFHNIALCL
jgi:hypothetical protein